ncbi:CBO0543 family protein [Evansella sp. AB-rgal1]|uniref:CBO0543 family protein n=1 Tax=Evansella sp. AB-rgal1 TaxID=3242696 RepID=UPI00359DC6D6
MAYKKERMILTMSWLVTAVLLLLFIPKNKIREAHVSFLFKQVITWLFGLVVVEKGLIKYPVRIFKKANKASFTFEYFVYPALCSIFNIYFPERKGLFHRGLYYTFHTSIIILFEIYAVKYTKLIKYPKWRWYWSFISIWMTYYFARVYYCWFFQKDGEGKSI